MTTTQKIINVVLIVALVITGIAVFSPKTIHNLGSQVQNDIWYFSGTPISTVTQGESYAQGGLVEGGVTTITPAVGTATTTLSFSSFALGSTIIINSASSTAQNVVIPGTSTISVASGFLSNVGDQERTVIDVASTTGPGIVLSAGAGVTLKYATSTGATVAGGNVVTLLLVRDTVNSIIGLVTTLK